MSVEQRDPAADTTEVTPPAARGAPPLAARRRRGPAVSTAGLFLGLAGCGLVLGAWYLTVDVAALPRFSSLPGLGQVASEWFSRHPVYGTSLFTRD